jgi:cephalosporin hydroxylase
MRVNTWRRSAWPRPRSIPGAAPLTCAICWAFASNGPDATRKPSRPTRVNWNFFPTTRPPSSRSQPLAKALAKPAGPAHPQCAQRSWHTSLPRETLLGLQQAVHHYTYRGVPMLKNPFDFAIYPVLIWKTKPKTIFEIGSKSGGSALWFGDMLDSFGLDGHIYSLDVVRVKDVTHPKVTFLEGDGRALEKSFTPDFLRGLPRPFLVIEDADHAYETSIATLRFFDPWLQPGEYIVVEDGIISDLDQDAACNSGPHKALKEMLQRPRTPTKSTPITAIFLATT